jgi:hypothetical protein
MELYVNIVPLGTTTLWNGVECNRRRIFLFPWSALTGLHDHSQWTHRTCWFFSWRVISPTQRPLPVNTQHSQETKSMPPAAFEPAIPANERPQLHALKSLYGACQHHDLSGLLYSYPQQVPAFICRGATHHTDARDLYQRRRELLPILLADPEFTKYTRVFYMPQSWDMGYIVLLPLRRKAY